MINLPLEDCMDAIIDYRGKTPRKTSAGIPLITAKIVKSGRIEQPEEFIDPSEYDKWMRRGLPKVGDVVITTEAPLGEVAQLSDARIALAQRLILLRGKPGVLDNTYLKYLLMSAAMQDQLTSRASGTTVVGIKQSELRTVVLPLPEIADQEAIASVLGSLDDKIEQNRRTGRKLEELARAVFKAWFVDFEPVKSKAAGATTFPGMLSETFASLPKSLKNSPLGTVPEGWEVCTIGDVANRIAMGPFGSDIKTDNFVGDGVPVIRGGNLTNGFVDRNFVYLTEEKADQLANANAFPGDIVITHRGTLGQIGLIPAKSRHRRYVVSQSQMLIRPNTAVLSSHFLYLFLTSLRGQHELLANRSQTGVPAISRPTTSLKAISLVIPERSVVSAFERFAATLFDARVAGDAESAMLATLRDYLLPRLLSGRIRIGESNA